MCSFIQFSEIVFLADSKMKHILFEGSLTIFFVVKKLNHKTSNFCQPIRQIKDSLKIDTRKLPIYNLKKVP
jgi:hypothetical protein